MINIIGIPSSEITGINIFFLFFYFGLKKIKCSSHRRLYAIDLLLRTTEERTGLFK